MFKLFKPNPFKTIFVNENSFVGSDDKFSLIKIFWRWYIYMSHEQNDQV